MRSYRGVGELHVITDETLQDRFSHLELARMAAEGGADVVQFREKRPVATRNLVETARAMGRALEGSRARLVVDDRVDVAMAAGVEAIHLGENDLDPELARRLLGPRGLIGATAHGLAEALRVAAGPVDYLGVGPVYDTWSKAGPLPALGLAVLRRISEAVSQPVIAVGSITPERVEEVLRAGAHGVAVISAVVCQGDPLEATRKFGEAIQACRSSVAGR